MPIIEATSTELVIRLTLVRQPESVVQEMQAEADTVPVFPYTIRTRLEVDGQLLGCITDLSFRANANSTLPEVDVDVLRHADWDNLQYDVRQSVERTVAALNGFRINRVVRVQSCVPSGDEPPEPTPVLPPGPTMWERLLRE